jgi:hypothetical protein
MSTPATQSQKPPTIRTSAGLRDTLFDELDRVINGKSTPAQANAVARLADQIASTVQLELEVAKMQMKTPNKPQSAPPSLQLGTVVDG